MAILLLTCIAFCIIAYNMSHRKHTHCYYTKPRTKSTPSPTKNYANTPKPAWVVHKVIRLKALLGNKAGCRRIAHTFNRLHSNKQTVSKSYVANVIKNNHYRIMQQRQSIKSKLPLLVGGK